jgi:prolyl-tRNA synthetase
MKYSQLLIPTVKEVPAEAEIASHQLMIRAGFIRKVASGTYTYLPLGWKILRKIMEIIRQEMETAGAQEILMPILQPMELWQRTGRDLDYGPTMFKLGDRKDAWNVLAPTAEEVVTSMMAGEINSYKQLPVCVYQISPKFRDELRPRFGVLRSREFIMKDAYSFHATLPSLEETYKKMYDAYCRVFTRCGLAYVIVEAESGPIGGSASHEFMVPCQAGEDIILSSDKNNYSANVEKCQIGLRPYSASFAGGTLPAADPKGELTKVHTPDCPAIVDVCAFMKVKPKNMLKTLVYEPVDEETRKQSPFFVAVVRGDNEVNEAKLRSVLGTAVQLADPVRAKAAGFVIGFVGPHVPVSCKIVVDPGAAVDQFWATGANEMDHHVKHFDWKRDMLSVGGDARATVADIRNAVEGDPSPMNDGGVLHESHGIEIGHVFKLGTKYSDKLGAIFQDETGAKKPCIMGCYGIGVNRILASTIESDRGHDVNGCILPAAIAPFEVEIVPINYESPEIAAEVNRIYGELSAAGLDVLLDDRDERAGVKFKDSDLLGIPLRIVVGDKGLKEGKVEFKRRTDPKATLVPTAEIVGLVSKTLGEMRNN